MPTLTLSKEVATFFGQAKELLKSVDGKEMTVSDVIACANVLATLALTIEVHQIRKEGVPY